MKRYLLISLGGMAAAGARAATDPASPTATELLDKFATSQERLGSFITQYEINRQDSGSGAFAWRGSRAVSGETGFDGHRCTTRGRRWGQIHLRLGQQPNEIARPSISSLARRPGS